MTPSEIMDKWLDTGSPDFLSEIEGEYLWAFLEAHIPDVVSDSYEYCGFEDYFELHKHVVAEKRAEYAAEVDIWLNAHAGLQLIRDQRKLWITHLAWYKQHGAAIPSGIIEEIIEALGEL